MAIGVLYGCGAFESDECPPGHMLWSCLSWDTFDRYEHQFREDVPIGTARPALIEYLTREQIAFRDSAWGSKGTAIFLRKDLSGSWKPQITVLIEIDANDRVSGIRFVRMLTGAP
ncbi:MAG: hypothetical protein JSR24_08390 [Proteobacteria bacterium]|nr:hypothetical protein [Pseudomonadota bacterium]